MLVGFGFLLVKGGLVANWLPIEIGLRIMGIKVGREGGVLAAP